MMTSNRPYMIRAFYEWIVDNECTPYIVVDATKPGVIVPQQFVQDGQIVLNINPTAVASLQMGNDGIEFNARFGGQPMRVVAPIYAVMAIYAKENGAGTMFSADETFDEPEESMLENDVPVEPTEPSFSAIDGGGNYTSDDEPEEGNKKSSKRSHLTVVK